MTGKRGDRAAALANIHGVFRQNKRFPLTVFDGDWERPFFFDSDWVFDATFVQLVKTLLRIEGAKCVCLANLDYMQDSEHQFFIDDKTTTDEFQKLLAGEGGGGSGPGWNIAIDRFGCVSDEGQWCIYCERPNEIAVIAFRPAALAQRYSQPISELRAAPIEDAIEQAISWGFSPRGLSAQWRQELLRHYRGR